MAATAHKGICPTTGPLHPCGAPPHFEDCITADLPTYEPTCCAVIVPATTLGGLSAAQQVAAAVAQCLHGVRRMANTESPSDPESYTCRPLASPFSPLYTERLLAILLPCCLKPGMCAWVAGWVPSQHPCVVFVLFFGAVCKWFESKSRVLKLNSRVPMLIGKVPI